MIEAPIGGCKKDFNKTSNIFVAKTLWFVLLTKRFKTPQFLFER